MCGCVDGDLVFVESMQRRVRGIEGEVEEEGLRLVPLDEVHGLGAEEVGEVVLAT